MFSLWAASTAVEAANVTNASFKSSTAPLQTTLLACEPAEIRATLYNHGGYEHFPNIEIKD